MVFCISVAAGTDASSLSEAVSNMRQRVERRPFEADDPPGDLVDRIVDAVHFSNFA